METNNYFDKELLSTKPEPETFFNLFTQDMDIKNDDIHRLHHQFCNLNDIDKVEVYNLALVNNKMDLYRAIAEQGEKGRGFEKVSKFETFNFPLPERSTKNSAGYDFFAPVDISVPTSIRTVHRNGSVSVEIGRPILVMTGVKAYMKDDEVLHLYNRSSNPGKKGLVLANSVAVIDADYYNNTANEGEIGFLFYNFSNETVEIKKGEKIGQGVFQKFLLADGDRAEGGREGGFGSTGK